MGRPLKAVILFLVSNLVQPTMILSSCLELSALSQTPLERNRRGLCGESQLASQACREESLARKMSIFVAHFICVNPTYNNRAQQSLPLWDQSSSWKCSGLSHLEDIFLVPGGSMKRSLVQEPHLWDIVGTMPWVPEQHGCVLCQYVQTEMFTSGEKLEM